MAKKKEETPKPDAPVAEVEETKVVEQVESPVEETKEVEVVEGKSLSGVENKVTHTLKSTKVFEPMQGVFKTVWIKE